MVFIGVSLLLVGIFLLISNNLVNDLAEQERSRMQIWANATRELTRENSDADVDFLLSIIEDNHNIPVLLVDADGEILLHRNFRLPESVDSLAVLDISERNMKFLKDKLSSLTNSRNKIEIVIDDNTTQYLYYEDSTLLKQLAYFPYIQLVVVLIFVAIAYTALMSVKRAEQNKVWVGLSKETAHQLGTPISSLMAWTQILPTMGVDSEIVADIDKDVQRLSTIADRFSKIGSMPDKDEVELVDAVKEALAYMQSRIPKRVKLTISEQPAAQQARVMLCKPLFAWVMENLTKNAVDAMDGEGKLDITINVSTRMALILVSDTGKGIARKNFKNVFTPGFTTKKRGWGLGLTLVKRIIEEYHGGRIYVKDSEIGRGTTFSIELPLILN